MEPTHVRESNNCITPEGPIVLMSDFGTTDGSAAVMEGVIACKHPRTKVIHMTHKVPSYSIISAAMLLEIYYKYYPKETIFVCAIDPGVGTKRKAVLIKANNQYFIGPDNGIFSLVLENTPAEWATELTNTQHFLPNVSNTFHGRDIFAPVAASLKDGYVRQSYGPIIDPRKLIITPEKRIIIEDTLITAKVLYVDDFGNLVIGIKKNEFNVHIKNQNFEISSSETRLITAKLSKTFADGEKGELIALFGGDFGDYMTIAVNMGNAREKTGLNINDRILIYPTTTN